MKHHIEENLCKRMLMVNWYLNSHPIHKRGRDGGLNPSAPFNAMNLSWHLTDILRGASEGEAMVGEWKWAWIGRNCNSLWIFTANFCIWVFLRLWKCICLEIGVDWGMVWGRREGRPSLGLGNSHIMRQRILQRSCFQPPACPTLLHQPCLVCHRGQHTCLLLLQLLSSAVGLCGSTLILCGNESCNEAILTSMPETSTLIKASR